MMKRLICVAALGAAAALAQAADVALETELGEIEAPMVIAVPADAAAEGGDAPDEPSGGKYVWAPGAPADGGGGEGWVTFEFNISEAGEYAIWGRIVAWDGNSDSFWVKIDGVDPDENPQESNNAHFRWAMNPKGTVWAWDRVNQWLDSGTFDRVWELPAGKQTLTIYSRENAAMLDCVFITDNLSGAAGDVPLRTPNADDVALQTGQTADVEPQGKLASFWAELKR